MWLKKYFCAGSHKAIPAKCSPFIKDGFMRYIISSQRYDQYKHTINENNAETSKKMFLLRVSVVCADMIKITQQSCITELFHFTSSKKSRKRIMSIF